MEIRIIIDDDALERIVRRAFEQLQAGQADASPGWRVYLVNCSRPADLLKIVEAPDTTAPGIRAEPHWRVLQEVSRGDVMLFRDAKRRAIAGHARADRRETGIHRHQRGMPALRWWLAEPVTYDPPLPDTEFIRIFTQHQQTSPGFRLFRQDNAYAQKAYVYPLDQEVLQAVIEKVGVAGPAAPTRS